MNLLTEEALAKQRAFSFLVRRIYILYKSVFEKFEIENGNVLNLDKWINKFGIAIKKAHFFVK